MNLNRTPNPLDRNARNSENDNWDIIEGEIRTIGGKVDDFIQEVSDEAFDKIVDNAKLNWKEPVDNFNSLPSNAQKGDTRMDRSTGKVYRYDGGTWKEIQHIDAGPVNELDRRISEQLRETNDYTDSSYSNLNSGKKGIKPLMTFICDDATIADVSKIKPIAEEKNVPFGIGVITSRVGTGNYANWEQIQELKDAGCEIMSHSHNHDNLTELTEDEMAEDLSTSLKILRQNGHNPTGFIYPYNANSRTTEKIVRRYFNFAYTKAHGSRLGRNYPTINNQAINRVALGSFFDGSPQSEFPQDGSSLEYYKARVDECLEKSNLLVFVIHSMETDSTQLQYLRDTIDYARSKGIPIVAPSEATDIYANIIEIKGESEFIVNADGEILSPDIGGSLLVENLNERGLEDGITDFKFKAVTYSPINTSKAQQEGFPEKQGGILVTYRLGSDYFMNYQEYITSTTSSERITYKRFLDGQLRWGDFSTSEASETKDYQMESFTIPANSSVDKVVGNLHNIKSSDSFVVFNARNNIPSGVSVSLIRYYTNTAVLRFSNVSDTSISVPSIRIDFKALN